MSRHRLLQPEKFEPSQFRIRTSKKVKQASNNYENVSPIYLPTSSQYSMLYNNQIWNDYPKKKKFSKL